MTRTTYGKNEGSAGLVLRNMSYPAESWSRHDTFARDDLSLPFLELSERIRQGEVENLILVVLAKKTSMVVFSFGAFYAMNSHQ